MDRMTITKAYHRRQAFTNKTNDISLLENVGNNDMSDVTTMTYIGTGMNSVQPTMVKVNKAMPQKLIDAKLDIAKNKDKERVISFLTGYLERLDNEINIYQNEFSRLAKIDSLTMDTDIKLYIDDGRYNLNHDKIISKLDVDNERGKEYNIDLSGCLADNLSGKTHPNKYIGTGTKLLDPIVMEIDEEDDSDISDKLYEEHEKLMKNELAITSRYLVVLRDEKDAVEKELISRKNKG